MISSIDQRIQFVTSRPAINYYHSRSVERMALVFHSHDTMIPMSPCLSSAQPAFKKYKKLSGQASKCTLNQSHPRLRWHNLRSWRWWCCVGGTWKVCQQGFNRIHNTFSNSSPSSIYAQFPAIAIKWLKQFDGCLSFFSHLNSWKSPKASKLLSDCAGGTSWDSPSWSIRISSLHSQEVEESRRFEIHRGPFASTIFASTFSRKRRSHRGENEFFSSYTSWILESDLWLQFGSVQEVDCWLLSGEILLVWLFSSGLTSIPQSLGTGLNFISGDRLTTAKRSIPSTARNRKRHQGNDEAVLPEKDAWNNQQL